MRKHVRGLWRHPDFLKLWAGQTISLFGSHIGGGALRYAAILLLGAGPAQISLLTVAALLPALLLGLPAGAWVDRLRRRPILIAADLGRALLLLSVPLAAALGALRVEQLYVVAALTGALSIFFDTAYQAFLPSVVGRRQLLEGNSKLGMSDSVAEIAGPPLGGALVQLISAPIVVLLDALSFLGSALALWRIRAVEEPPPQPAERPALRRELAEGLRAVASDPLLRALLGCMVTSGLAGGIIGTLYDIYLIRDLGLSPAQVGLTIGVGGVSALAGAFVAERVTRRFGLGRTLIGTTLLGWLTSLMLPLVQGPVWLAFGMLLLMQAADLTNSVFSINALSLRQSIVPDRLLGRVNACFNLMPMAAGLLGALAGGALGEMFGPRAAMAVAVSGGLLSVLWLVGAPVRRLRAAPTGA